MPNADPERAPRRVSPRPAARAASPSSVEAMLCFTRPQDVGPDHEQPHRLRARTLDPDALLRSSAGLQQAIDTMEALLLEAREPASAPSSLDAGWARRARDAASSVIRRSLEMRAVGLMLPRRWPRARASR